MLYPIIKPYEAIVQTAAELFDMPFVEVEEEMYERLCGLGLTKLGVMIYVNWASWNALTYNELVEYLGISIESVKWETQKLRRVFPQLFCGGQDRATQ